jgi:diguanylate cyclase (GGDEF)-like protein/PAS domain S-box-containing protein
MMFMFYLVKSAYQSVFERRSGGVVLLTLLCASVLWLQATRWYEFDLLDQESVRINQDLSQHAQKLSSLIHKRFALLRGLASFVEADIVHQHELTSATVQRTETFLSGLRSSTEGIRNFAIAPNGIIRYISPLAGNEKAIEHDLLSDSRPSGRDVSQRAIQHRMMVLTDPIELVQGELGLVARQAIFSSGEFWGLVSMVLDVPPLLREAGLFNTSINMALRDRQGQVFFGMPQTFDQTVEQTLDQQIVIQRVDLPDGYWELAARPASSTNSEIQQQLAIFQITLAAFLLLLIGLIFAQHWRQKKTFPPQPILAQSVYKQTAQSHNGTPTWFSPALTSVSVILAMVAFYLFLQRNDLTTQRQNLNNTMAVLNNNLQRRLDAHREYLQLLAEQIAQQQLVPESFQTRASRYINDHPGLINITWADSQFVIRHTAPYKENRQVIGLTLSLPEPKRASHLAYNTHRPVYTKPFTVIQGHPAFELYVPIFNDGQFLGTLGGVYVINQLLEGLVSDSVSEQYKVEFLDTAGKLIHSSSPNRTPVHLTINMPISDLQQELWLRISAYDQDPKHSMQLLLLLAMLLATGIAFSLWQQYRESCKHWKTGESLWESQQHFRAIAEASPMAIIITHPWHGLILYANAQAHKLLKPVSPSLVGNNIQQYYSDYKVRQKFLAAMKQDGHVDNFEFRIKKGDNTEFWASISSQKVHYDQDIAIITSISDLTERKRYEDQLFQQANFDSLTGLPNRGLAFDRLQYALTRARRDNFKVALIMLDLDHFKKVNDSLGHNAGDLLLKEIAHRMTTCVRRSDTVARIGGDEFTLILPELANAMEAELITRKIIKACTTPLFINGHEVLLSASLGVAIFPEDGDNQDILLKNADTAMYTCKKEGRNNFRFYTNKMNEQAQIKLKMELELRRALEHNEFSLHYQPLIATDSWRVEGVEALLRWHNPLLGQVSPATFIPLAESIGIINELGQWVLDTACCQIKQWRNLKGMPQYVAVNVSGNQLRQNDLAQIVARALAKFDLPPAALELEITESILLENTENNRKTLQRIHAMGVRLAIDDFGTGYSSLSYLRRFPFDTLKIDRSFIKDVPEEEDAAKLVSAIISMADVLGLKIVAEGVENQQQLDFISARNCHLTQGFFLAKPMPGEKMADFIRTFNVANKTPTTIIEHA